MWMILLVLLRQALDRPFLIATRPSKLNSPFHLHAMMQSGELSSMYTATTTCNKGAPNAQFLVQADDCSMIPQDWTLKPIGNESKQTCPWRYGIASSPSSSCSQRFGRRIVDWAERMIPIRLPYCKGFSFFSTGQQPNEDIWQRKHDYLQMFLAGKLSTCCIGLPRNSSLAPCLRSTEINCCNGSRKSDFKTVQGHGSSNIDPAPPLGKTGRKWSFKYGLRRPRRCRRQRRARCMGWRLAVLQGSPPWKQMQLSLRSTWRFFCTLTCHPQSSNCLAARLVGLSGIATFISTMMSARSGPKSGVRIRTATSWRFLRMFQFLLLLYCLRQADGVKVEMDSSAISGASAKPRGGTALMTNPDNQAGPHARQVIKKRAYRRALNRALQHGTTRYRGRVMTPTRPPTL